MYAKIVLLALSVAAWGGCYSSARHVANVRTATVMPDATLTTKYRLERIVLKKSSFSSKVAGGYEQFEVREREVERKKEEAKKQIPAHIDIDTYMNAVKNNAEVTWLNNLPAEYRQEFGQKYYETARNNYYTLTPEARRNIVLKLNDDTFESEKCRIESDRKAYAELLEEDKKSGPDGTHSADTQMIFYSVCEALGRCYPSVFADTADAIPIAVVVDWATEYKPLPDYSSIFSYWLWPVAAEQETIYYLYVVENPGNKTDEELWNAYIAAPKKYPRPPEFGFAVRMSEVWESALVLPTGFIPCPGESDFPKTYCFMRNGKDSLVLSPAKKIESRDCFKHMVFEPKVDGDVIAAAIMRVINRKHRIAKSSDMMKGGAR